MSTISPQIQVKLLRVLEERAIQRVGSTQRVAVDFRLIAATNDDLQAKVEAGEFREDLFYRLNVFPVTVPPLRERPDDIPVLAYHFRLRFAQENQLQPPEIPPVTLARMAAYDWPGNVRELENFIERSVIMYAGAREIRFDHPAADRRGEQLLVRGASDQQWSLDRLEREYIMAILEQTGGHQVRASEILGIDRRTLYRKLRAMGVRPRRTRDTVAAQAPDVAHDAASAALGRGRPKGGATRPRARRVMLPGSSFRFADADPVPEHQTASQHGRGQDEHARERLGGDDGRIRRDLEMAAHTAGTSARTASAMR
jgi:hypothetical protein